MGGRFSGFGYLTADVLVWFALICSQVERKYECLDIEGGIFIFVFILMGWSLLPNAL